MSSNSLILKKKFFYISDIEDLDLSNKSFIFEVVNEDSFTRKNIFNFLFLYFFTGKKPVYSTSKSEVYDRTGKLIVNKYVQVRSLKKNYNYNFFLLNYLTNSKICEFILNNEFKHFEAIIYNMQYDLFLWKAINDSYAIKLSWDLDNGHFFLYNLNLYGFKSRFLIQQDEIKETEF